MAVVNKPQAAGMVSVYNSLPIELFSKYHDTHKEFLSDIDRLLHLTMYVHKVMHKSRVNLPIVSKLELAI